MRLAKRVLLFILTNVLVIVTLSVAMSALGIRPYLEDNGINYRALLAFCAIWGFGGALISLAISRIVAKWAMGVRVIDPQTTEPEPRSLVRKVHYLARKAGIKRMPEVGIYEADELNAFATGPTRNRSLVAVSSGLLRDMSETELEGVLAHEVAHIANGDMVTMTLVQGVVNAFVMFLARVIGFTVSQLVSDEKRNLVQFLIVFVLEIALGILGMIAVSYFSRIREYRADDGGASLSTSESMISALEKLKTNQHQAHLDSGQTAIASLKISGKAGGFLKLFSTHPDLDDRIQRLRNAKFQLPERTHFASIN